MYVNDLFDIFQAHRRTNFVIAGQSVLEMY